MSRLRERLTQTSGRVRWGTIVWFVTIPIPILVVLFILRGCS